jgi:hypothetical protein
VRGAMPVGDNDLVTKAYADQLAARFIVTAQFNGANPLPNNTGVEHFIVVTTTGPNAAIGQLLWDNGSGSGVTQLISLASGNAIVPTIAMSGGTITLLPDSIYVWDAGSSSYVNASGSSMSGAIREVRYAITNAASQDSASLIPANAIIVGCRIKITTPFSAGATITVGQAGNLTLLQQASDNLPTVAADPGYDTPLDVAWGAAALAVRTTVGGAPAAGAGFVSVWYTVPNN